jgi:hypothetical protein
MLSTYTAVFVSAVRPTLPCRLDRRGRETHEPLRRIGRPHLHDGRVQQPRRGLRDPAQHVVDDERFADVLLQLRQLAQTLGAPRGVRVEKRVVDGQRGVLGQQPERGDVLGVERARRPVVNDQRPVHTALGPQRRRRHRLEPFPLDLRAALRPQHGGRVVENVLGRHHRGLQDGAADRAAADGNAPLRGVLVGEPARRAHHGEVVRDAVPGHHQRGIGAHHLERAGDDRSERLVEIERGRQRPPDRLQRAHERRAPPLLGDVDVRADDAADPAVGGMPWRVPGVEPAGALGDLISDVACRRADAAERAGKVIGNLDVAQEGEDGGSGAADGVRPWDPGQLLHRGIPADYAERGVGDDDRVVEALDEAGA